MNIGELINKGLRSKKMTQNDLAQKLSVSRQSIAQWISGKNQPTLDKFFKIVEILDLHEEFSIPAMKIESEEIEKAKEEIQKLKSKIEIMENVYSDMMQSEQEYSRELREELLAKEFQEKLYNEKINSEILDEMYELSERYRIDFIDELSLFLEKYKKSRLPNNRALAN